MNYFGNFDAKASDALGQLPFGHIQSETVHATHVPSGAVVVSDAHLLFGAEFKRTGVDLVLSGDGREVVLHDYFKGEHRAPLASPDGAHLTGDIVTALAGEVQYAQADGNAGAHQVIGHVTKLTGTATATRNGVSIILNNGDNVEKGDVVASGSDSTLGITFIDGTVFGLSSNARMVLNEMVYDPNGSNNSSLLSLVAGTITFVAGETAKHGDMKVDTPVATMGIRGTAVLVEIDFNVPGGTPDAKFQVLVEPDGSTGSYILFDKTTLTPLAVVDHAGLQININNGVMSQTLAPLSPEIQKLINDVFTLKFTDNSTTKSLEHFTDTIVPLLLQPLKLIFAQSAPTLPVITNLVVVNTAGSGNNASGGGHVPVPPAFDSINDGNITELAGVTGSKASDPAAIQIHYRDVNSGDQPTVSVKFASFGYTNAQGQPLTLNMLQQKDVAAVEAITNAVNQGTLLNNKGLATWTYQAADGAFDFLAAGEKLTLTFNAIVDNNFAPNDQTGSQQFTITITGTNDVPVITSSQQNISFAAAGTDTKGGDLIPNTATSGQLIFTDPDLTDTHTVAVKMTSALLDGQPLAATVGQVVIDELSAAVTASIAKGNDSTGSGSGTIDWALANLQVYLADLVPSGESLVLTYAVTVTDSQGATSVQDIVVTIGGNNSEVLAWIDTSPIPPGGALWSSALNWEGDVTPDVTHDVVINNNQVNPKTPTFPVTVNADAGAKSLAMNDFSDGTGTPTLDVEANVTLTIAGALNLNTDTATDPDTGAPLVLPTAEAIINNFGTISVGGIAELLKHSVLNNYGKFALNQGGDFDDQSSITNSGTIEVVGGTLTSEVGIANSVTTIVDNSPVTILGTIQIDGGAKLKLTDGAAITGGEVTLGNLSVLDVEKGAASLPAGTPDATLDGVTVTGTSAGNPSAIEVGTLGAATLLLDDGTTITNVNVSDALGSTIDLASSTISGGTLNNSGTLDSTGTSFITNAGIINSGTLESTGGTLTIDPPIAGPSITNSGTLEANGGALDITSEGITNTGTLRAIDDSILTLTTLTVTNTGGTVSDALGSAIDLVSATISGGKVNNSGTLDSTGTSFITNAGITNSGTLESTGGTLTIDPPIAGPSITNSGTLEANGGALDITSEGITNTGTLRAIDDSILTLTTLTVTNTGGTVSDALGSAIDLVSATISGGKVNNSGTLDSTGTSLITNAGITNSGTLESTGGTLTIDPPIAGPSINNTGTLEANGGALDITSDPITNSNLLQAIDNSTLTLTTLTVTNTGGTVSDALGSTIDLASSTISGGTLSNSGTLDSTGTSFITNAGITNSGTLEANGGVLALSTVNVHNAGGVIEATGTGSVVALANTTISGGTLTTGNASSSHNGVIEVVATDGANLSVLASSGVVETNVNVPATVPWFDSGIAVVAGEQITISASGFVSFGESAQDDSPTGIDGQLAEANKVAPGLPNESLVGEVGSGTSFEIGAGTTFTATTSGELHLSIDDDFFGDNSGSWSTTIALPQAVTNTGFVQVDSGANLGLQGLIDNQGTIDVGPGAESATSLEILGTVALYGGGAVSLDGSSDKIVAGTGGGTLYNSETIHGAGAIGAGDGALTLNNEAGGVIDADVKGGTLTLDTGNQINNAGLLEAANDSTLVLNNQVVTNTGGTVSDALGSAIDLVSTTISGGKVNNSGTLDSTGTSFITNAGITNSGTLESTGGTLTIDPPAGPSINNTGTLEANGGALDITSDPITNSNLLQAIDNSTLTLTTLTVTNTGGTVSDALGSTIELVSATISGGKMNNSGTLDSTGTSAVSSVISGSGALTASGGTLTLSGLNTYSGATTIDSGAVLVAGVADAFSANSAVTDNGKLDLGTNNEAIAALDGTNAAALVGSFSGTGIGPAVLTIGNGGSFAGVIEDGTAGAATALTLTAGTETLGGANTYSGVTTINGGTLALSGLGSIAGSSDVVDDGTFDISGTSGASIVTLSGTSAGTVNLGGKTLTLSNASTEFDGVIEGTGGLTLTAGTETLGGANTYSGVTTINGGTLKLSGAGSIAGSSDVIDDGTLDISATSGASIVTLSGTSAGTVNLGGKTLTLSKASTEFDGVIEGSGGLTLTAGTETLGGANLYSGVTTINGGTLALSGSGSIADSSDVVDDGTLDISATSGASIVTLSGTSAGTVNLGGKTLTLSKASTEFDGVIEGSGGLTLTAGTETLGGANTYSGVTTINGGTLALLGSGSIADSSDVIDDGTFDISGLTRGTSIVTLSGDGTVTLGANTLTLTKGNDTFSGVIGGSGGLTVDGTGSETLTNTNTYSGATTIGSGETLALTGTGSISDSSDVVDNGTFDISGTSGASIVTLSGAGAVKLGTETLTLTDASTTFSGAIGGSGGLTLTAGTETLTGDNLYTGATTINGGTLKLSGLGSIAGSSDVVDDGTFDISATSGASIVTLSGTGTVTLGAKTLTLTKGNDTFSGVIGGSGGLTVDGTGTETLTNTNTYTGATTIGSGETLALTGSGSIADSSGVADGGTFDISGLTNGGTSITTLSGAGNVNLGSKTLTLTKGNDTFSGVINGTGGGLTVDGTGTEALTNTNTYSGATTIGSGETLALTGLGSVAKSSGVADGGTFDISATSGASIVTLSGTSAGTVNLGGKTLTLTDASTTFNGAIGGTGGLTLTAGTETLAGTNTYSGATTINGSSTLALTVKGSVSDSSGVADGGTFDISGLTNGGTSITTLSGAGNLKLGANTLTLTNASTTFSGAISSNGGDITVAGGALTLGTVNLDDVTLAGSIGNSGTMTIDGTVNLDGASITGGTIDIVGELDSSGTSFITGATIINTDHIVVVSGSLKIDPTPFTNAGIFEVKSSSTFVGEAVTNSGIVAQVATNGTIQVDQGGTLTLDSSSITGGIVSNKSGGTIDVTAGSTSSTASSIKNTVSFINAGTVDADDATLDLVGTSLGGITVNNTGGLLEAIGTGVLNLDNVTINGGSLGGNGTIDTASTFNTLNGVTIASGATVEVTDGAVLDLLGAISGGGTIALGASGDFTGLEISGVLTLGSGGNVTMTDDAHNFIASNGSAATLTNFDTISGAGTIGDIHLTLVNSGTIDATGTHALTINTGLDNSFTAAGLVGNILVTNNHGGVLEAAAGHTLQIDDNVLNNGTIEADSSGVNARAVVDITGNVTGTTGMTGSIDIFSNATVEIGGSVSSNQTVNFDTGGTLAAKGLLILDDSHHFSGTIAGLTENPVEGQENQVDLRDLAYLGSLFTHAHFSSSSDTVTVSNFLDSVTLHVSGNSSGSFEVSSDGRGGTLLSDPAASGNVTVDSNQTLDISAASSATVDFTNTTGTTGALVLDDSKDFSGAVVGFTGDGTTTNSDLIDVTDVNIANVALNKTTYADHGNGTGTLTLYGANGQALDSINFAGAYQLANFTIESDGDGGTLIVDPPVNTNGQSSPNTQMASNQNPTGTAATDGFAFNFTGPNHAPTTDFHPGLDTSVLGGPMPTNLHTASNAVPDQGNFTIPLGGEGHDHFGLAGFARAQLHSADFHFV